MHLAQNPKRIIVQWVGIGTHTHTVYGETSGSDISVDHGLQAQRHLITYNSEAGHENLKNYINCMCVSESNCIALTRNVSQIHTQILITFHHPTTPSI